MRFHFDDRKTAQAAAYLLKRHDGKLPKMVLIKLLYLADRKTLLDIGRPITGDRMFAMKHGPVLSEVLDLMNEGPDGNASSWFEYINPPAEYDVTLRAEAPTDELSRYEMRVLAEVDERYGQMNRWALVDLLHRTLPEWKDPGTSRLRIDPEDILRAESVSEEEIARVAQDAKESLFLDTLTA